MTTPVTVYDVCVVGAGMWGSSAAYHLSLVPDQKVCLIGPNEPASPEEFSQSTIFGAHYDEGRLTRLNMGNPILGMVAKRATEGYQEVEEKTGISFFRKCKNINFALADSDYIISGKKTCEILKVDHVLLDNVQLKERYPYIDIQEGRQCILQLSKAGIINARKYVDAHKRAAKLQGCHVIDDIVDHMTESSQSEGGVIYKVDTESGHVILARKVLLCTGAFTNFKNLVPKPLHFTMTPEQTLRVEVDPDDPRFQDMPTVTSFTRITEDTDCYVIPPTMYPDGKTYVKIGHGRLEFGLNNEEEAVTWFRGKGTSDVKDKLMKMLAILMPEVKVENTQTDTCISVCTATGKPYCGMITPTIGVLMGGNGEGAKLAHEIGRIGAKMMVKGQWDYDLPQEEFKICFENC